MTKFFSLLSFCAIAVIGLSACSSDGDDRPPLEGERLSVLDLQKELITDVQSADASKIIIPPLYKNAFWPQAGGYPSHVMQNLGLNIGEDGLKRLWRSSIGEGSGRIPLTAQPIIADGKAYTLDSRALLSAFDITNGRRLWQVSVKHLAEDEPVIGGGVAFADGTLYVSAGYDEALAVSPEDGTISWRTPLPAPARAAPTVMQGRVFLTLLNNTIVALNAGNGEQIWEHNGNNQSAGLVGAASPAADRDIVVPGLSSGELLALRVENGALAWKDNLLPSRRIAGLSGISDIRAMPVLEGDLIIAISYGGKIAALDKRTGNRLWQRDISGAEMPWIAANVIYVLSSDNELIALDKTTGAIYWMSQLDKFENMKKRTGALNWTGPLMADGRLILAGTNGHILEIDPSNGAIINRTKTRQKVRISPVIASGMLFILSEDGSLSAYQ